MKNNAFWKYIAVWGIYTLVFYGAAWIMDNLFNGFVLDSLAKALPDSLFSELYFNQEWALLVGYLFGAACLSAVWVFRLSRLFRIATTALENETSVVLSDKCPEELVFFGQKLKEVRALAQENEQARQTAEQQKNDLVVYLAHDLKTPLTSVIGYLSLLTEAPDMPREQREKYTGIALDKAYRLEMLVNEFFDMTRLNLHAASLGMAAVNLSVLLLQMGEEFYPLLAERSLTFLPEMERDLTVRGNSDLLARAFDNLLRNAAVYGLPGTEVICRAYREGEAVHILLSNACEPVSKEQLNRLFEKFYRPDTARRSIAGAGLGLAISKQILELHEGSIDASYKDGRMEMHICLKMSEKCKNGAR